MPALITKGTIAIISVIFFSLSPIINYIQTQTYVLNHTETHSTIIFNCKTKEQPAKVIIEKNTGKVKISFRNKRNNVEFDLEYSGEISPEDRANVDEIMKSINEYTKKDKTINGKIKNWVKEFVNRKL